MPPIVPIPDKETHERLIASNPPPTVLYLSSSVLPACKAFTPHFERLAREWNGIRFCQMEYSSETSALFKFTQAQLPIVVLICGERWCRTLLGLTVEEVERGLGELQDKANEAGRQ